jgi:hypothetical protein
MVCPVETWADRAKNRLDRRTNRRGKSPLQYLRLEGGEKVRVRFLHDDPVEIQCHRDDNYRLRPCMYLYHDRGACPFHAPEEILEDNTEVLSVWTVWDRHDECRKIFLVRDTDFSALSDLIDIRTKHGTLIGCDVSISVEEDERGRRKYAAEAVPDKRSLPEAEPFTKEEILPALLFIMKSPQAALLASPQQRGGESDGPGPMQRKTTD